MGIGAHLYYVTGAFLTLDFGRNSSRGYSTRDIALSGRGSLGEYFYKTQKGWISVVSPLRHMPGGSYQNWIKIGRST